MSDREPACHDCGLPYGERGFHDLIIPLYLWRIISPTGDGGGLLCPNCICARLDDKGISNVPAAFMSGPLRTVSPETMDAMRRIENLEELHHGHRAQLIMDKEEKALSGNEFGQTVTALTEADEIVPPHGDN